MDTASRNTSSSSLYESHQSRAETKSRPINVACPEMRRTSSAEHNALMRQIMAPWGSLSSTPPACRAVSYSSWRHFSATSSNQSKSRDEMTASALLGANGLAPEFDPPVLERCNLRIAEEVLCGNPTAEPQELPQLRQRNRNPRYYPRFQRTQSRRTSSTSSWSTFASEGSYQPGASEPITFEKQMVRPASTSSLLTMSFKGSPKASRCTEPPKVVLDKIGKEFGIESLSIDDLPEDAFESDSEDGD
ncbi:hypothetical protein P171DRAFT_435716 [Karstenula rhodostoma CBS 690.94]|uniref:Uncharacterized protein n=1 Tax=Karstenula rhodostoma CBS 690.94 TaxID=1392251 RepID=A0A9P4P9A8_9PLEO|nr:hypothetical protein P171DRAFT_435716 [Karstenula rhodostoma CBS 690.94]